MEKESENASCAGLLEQKNESVCTDRNRRGKHRLSVCSKICYAIGGAPYQITGTALGFFLQIFLLDVVQMSPFHASIILFTGRIWDAVTDPLVGFFVSKTSWTRLGRLLPWIIISTPFGVLSYFLIWFVPGFSGIALVLWYLTFYCLFQTLITCFHVPYSALTMFISKEQSDRDSATGYPRHSDFPQSRKLVPTDRNKGQNCVDIRKNLPSFVGGQGFPYTDTRNIVPHCDLTGMTVEVLGTVLGTAIQGQIVGNVVTPCVSNSNSSVSLEDINSTHDIGSLTSTRDAYMIAAGVIGVIYVVCAIVLTLGVREERDSCELLSDQPFSFWQGLKLVMSHGPYIKLITGFLFTSLAFMLLEGNFALFLTYTMGFRRDYQNILLVIMISATLTVPFWQWFLTRYGKKTAVYFGISSVVPFLILVVLMKSNLIIAYIVAVAAGLSVAAAFLLPWSMLPDVIDDFLLKNPDSHGHEAIFFSFYVFFTKFASGVSLGISTLSLDFAGYQTRGCSQPEQVNVTLKLLVCAAPVVLICMGLLLFKLYPIDEERRKENKKELQLIRDLDRDSDSDSPELASNV